MISRDEVKKLASLSRLALTDVEEEKFQGEIEAILGFVAKVKEAAEEAPIQSYASTNVMRSDIVVHEREEFTEKLLQSAPNREGKYLKVKKILE